jgi:hypothetical protein
VTPYDEKKKILDLIGNTKKRHVFVSEKFLTMLWCNNLKIPPCVITFATNCSRSTDKKSGLGAARTYLLCVMNAAAELKGELESAIFTSAD